MLCAAVGIAAYYHYVHKGYYDIDKCFPLNVGDKYTYIHHEDSEKNTVTITVTSVKAAGSGKQFDFLWQGKFNDRIMTNTLTREGIMFNSNRQLTGEVPHKVVRVFSPALLMLPSYRSGAEAVSVQSIYDYEGNLLGKERVEAVISYIGSEKLHVQAGDFPCEHFFIRNTYKDDAGLSKHMHTYDFWVAEGAGFVKMIHAFVPLANFEYNRPEEKTLMNRYRGTFIEVFELEQASPGRDALKN